MMDHDPRAVEVERHMAKAARLVRRLRAACEAELAAGEEGTRDGHGHEALRKARKFLVRREEQGEVVAEQVRVNDYQSIERELTPRFFL